jgi:hypothetical protein
VTVDTESNSFLDNNITYKGGEVMSQYLRFSAKTNRGTTGSRKTQNAKQNHWTSDDVHRIAQRSPSLYQTVVVPKVRLSIPTGRQIGQGAYNE